MAHASLVVLPTACNLLSFWVKASVTGTYSINITKYDGSVDRFHVKTYTINSANTWEYKTMSPIYMATEHGLLCSSSWIRTMIIFGSGLAYVRTNQPLFGFRLYDGSQNYGSTMLKWKLARATGRWNWTAHMHRCNMTSSPLLDTYNLLPHRRPTCNEEGDTATPFEHRSYGQELALCQRYYVNAHEPDDGDNVVTSWCRHFMNSSNVLVTVCNFPVEH